LPDVWIDLNDGGELALEFGKRLGDPAFQAAVLPFIRDANERQRDLSVS
jgi:hypothetical protein